jgi:hypothetical protein
MKGNAMARNLLKMVIATLAMSLGTLNANAAAFLSGGTWTPFDWVDNSGAINPGDGYRLFVSDVNPALLRITDCCIIGDQFHVTVRNGSTIFAEFDTSPITTDDGVNASDNADESWADPRLSKGSITLDSGVWDIGITVIRFARGTNGGGAFIRADEVSEQQVPEPLTLALTALGLAALRIFRRTRRA